MRQELRAGTYGKPPVDVHTPFTDLDFKVAAAFREAVDRDDAVGRYRVTVIPKDGARREFHLIGSLEQVEARAQALFPQSQNRVVLIEAEKRPGGEVVSSRLCLSTK